MHPANSSGPSTSSLLKSRPPPTSSQDGTMPRKRSRFESRPTTTSPLLQISSERDTFTDGDHKELDAAVLGTFSLQKEFKRMPDLPFLLCNIINDDMRLPQISSTIAKELLEHYPSIAELLKVAWEAESFKKVRQLEIFWPAVQRPRTHWQPGESHQLVSDWRSAPATMHSWNIKYVGNTANLLYKHLSSSNAEDEIKYARYTSIVQSSGMGKSRAVDELSKKYLVVPLCLRERQNGFPPADHNVRDWFLRHGKTKIEAFTRSGAFLCALFDVLHRYLQQIDVKIADIPPDDDDEPAELAESLAAKFRLLMRAGHTFEHQGDPRRRFYDEVLQLADQLSLNTVNGVKYDITEAIDQLMKYLIPGFEAKNAYPPTLIISFDEAHCLATTSDDSVNGPWSRFSELRRALQAIQSHPCFSVFLSTTGKISQFTPAARHDQSNRLQRGQLKLITPFCELGFDQLAKKAVPGQTTLADVSSTGFMTSLGRPLFASRYITGDMRVQDWIVHFAGEKLLCREFRHDDKDFVRYLNEMEKLAIISVRIPLEFTVRTLDSQDTEAALLEKHMRVYLSLDSGFETAVTVAPSEPILAEASSYVMRNTEFDLPHSLLVALQHPGLDKGSRGELIVMTLCVQARDAAVSRIQKRIIPVNAFIEELIAPAHHDEVLLSDPTRVTTPGGAETTLRDTFSESYMYFNHFIKLHDHTVINQRHLCGLITRGAAAICGDQQYGIDIVVPFLCNSKDGVLRPENVSAFFIQCKNDATFQAEPQTYLFDMMNPYDLQFFAKENITPVPVIRMVFALASLTPCVTVISGPSSTQAQRSGKAKFQADKYTTFDIWCGKASHETFRPIMSWNDHIFHELLRRSRVFADVYDEEKSGAILRSMNPATESNEAHWHFLS